MANNNDYKKVAAWFIGPKGENGPLFQDLLNLTIEEHTRYRREHYKKNDPEYITQKIKDSDEYGDQVKHIKQIQNELFERLHGSVPFYTPRYQAHMLWDTVIPGTLGYMTAMLYNQNNVATEASPATSKMEQEVGQQLCEMIGYDTTNSWGHITADGSIANLEAMWAARNIKYYPLAVKEALMNTPELANARENLNIKLFNTTVKRFKDCSIWELLNIDEDTALLLPKQIISLTGISSDMLNQYLAPYLLQNKGFMYYAKKYPDMKEPKIFVPATYHYSWPKAATILGLGKDCVEGIPVNEYCCIDISALEKRLIECARDQVPVIMVVNVIGSTEEGAVDNLSATLELRAQYSESQETDMLYFHIHCDAAWGGYLKTMLIEPRTNMLEEEGYVPVLPISMFCSLQYDSLCQADTVTIDPHKAGFIPYPAGSLSYRNEKLRSMITFDASYIHSDPGLNMGIYGVEGSKPGAAAAAVWTAHKTIPLDKSGYGRILGECAFSAKRYYCQWLTLATEKDDFEIRMLVKLPNNIRKPNGEIIIEGQEAIKSFIKSRIIDKSNEEISQDEDAMQVLREIGTDVLINSFIVNFKTDNGEWNHNPQDMNRLNQAIFDMFSISDPETAQKDNVNYIIMMTSLNPVTYQAPLLDIEKAWNMDFSSITAVNCLVNTIMNPWATTNKFLDDISDIFKTGIKKCVKDLKINLKGAMPNG